MARNGAEKKELTARQVQAIEALAMGYSQTATAKQVGIGRTTLRRWLQEPAFAAELQRLEGEALKVLTRRLLTLGESAVVAIADGLRREQTPAIRLRAAGLVVTNALALAEMTQIEERLAALEAQNGGAR